MKSFVYFLGILLIVSVNLKAQNVRGKITSSFYSFERYSSLDNSDRFLRAYQTMNLNVTQSKFAFRTRINFEGDLINPLERDPKLRFYNLYFEGKNISDILSFKIGRQPIYNSVAGGLFDGIHLKLKYKGFKLTGYFGGNVAPYQKLKFTDDLSNDYIAGGKLTVTEIKNLRFELSYVDKNFKPVDYSAIRLDENLNPINVLIRKNSNQFRFISGAISYKLKNAFRINTKYDYDLNFETTSKFMVSARYEQIKNLGISLFYNFREPRIRYNSIFAVFNYGNTQELEGGLDYKINNKITVFGKFGNVTYKDENSQRLTLGINSNFGSLSFRKTFGYAGELDAISVYSARTFLNGLLTPSVGLAYTSYKLSPDAEKNKILSFLGGINIRPWKLWSFDLQAQYFNNKIYKNDLRMFFKINYWFNTNLNLL